MYKRQSKYNANVLKAGQVDGKQYIMPLTYRLPLVLTTQELLDKTGFDISTADNYNAFLEECLKYKQANIPGAPELSLDSYMRPYICLLYTSYIDYYNNSRIQAKTKWMPPSKFREASMMES